MWRHAVRHHNHDTLKPRDTRIFTRRQEGSQNKTWLMVNVPDAPRGLKIKYRESDDYVITSGLGFRFATITKLRAFADLQSGTELLPRAVIIRRVSNFVREVHLTDLPAAKYYYRLIG
jgi:hypothetical protein